MFNLYRPFSLIKFNLDMIEIDSSRHIKTRETKTHRYWVYPKFTLQSFGFDNSKVYMDISSLEYHYLQLVEWLAFDIVSLKPHFVQFS